MVAVEMMFAAQVQVYMVQGELVATPGQEAVRSLTVAV